MGATACPRTCGGARTRSRRVRSARFAAKHGQAEGLRLAREAVAAFLYTHLWVGEWHEIDPGFDDRFGNYGACGVELWRAAPDDEFLAHITRSGVEHFLPRWHDALRFGGNIAADQIRCWKLMIEACELDPSLRAELAPVLRDAVHAHLAGQQYSNGAWGDVTFKHGDPRTELAGCRWSRCARISWRCSRRRDRTTSAISATCPRARRIPGSTCRAPRWASPSRC